MCLVKDILKQKRCAEILDRRSIMQVNCREGDIAPPPAGDAEVVTGHLSFPLGPAASRRNSLTLDHKLKA